MEETTQIRFVGEAVIPDEVVDVLNRWEEKYVAILEWQVVYEGLANPFDYKHHWVYAKVVERIVQ